MFRHQRGLQSSGVVGYLRGNRVITATQELHEAKAVAEGIGQQRKLAPGVGAYRLFQPGSHGNGLLHGSVDVLDKEIEMNWRPVTTVITTLAACRRSRCVRLLDQQIDRRGTAKHLYTGSTEAAADTQPEHRAVKSFCPVQIINVDVYQHVHRS